jgi:hypothetical protein
VNDATIRADLLAAAGVSDKAQNHLQPKDQAAIVEAMIKAITAAGARGWREEILYRFLLTRGDSLGGSMRNWTGAQAAAVLASAVGAELSRRRITARLEKSPDNPDKTQSIIWPNRALLMDRKLVKNNVDAILLDTKGLPPAKKFKADKSRCLALGELKGGIDPAGADKHWKTARAALDRLQEICGTAPLFFVGAAIEAAMADEIFNRLRSGQLRQAANLTEPKQLAALARWICSL